MSATPSPGAESAADPNRLGRAAAERLRPPGASPTRRIQPQIGVLASSITRFASSVSRPVEARLALRGPGQQTSQVRPPRWWTPMAQEPESPAATSAVPDASADTRTPWLRSARPVETGALPSRNLPRAARAVEAEQSYTPGGMLSSLTSVEARVRRHSEVSASGPMLTQNDRQKLTVVRRRVTATAADAPAPPAPAARAARPTPTASPAPRTTSVTQPPDPGTASMPARSTPKPSAPETPIPAPSATAGSPPPPPAPANPSPPAPTAVPPSSASASSVTTPAAPAAGASASSTSSTTGPSPAPSSASVPLAARPSPVEPSAAPPAVRPGSTSVPAPTIHRSVVRPSTAPIPPVDEPRSRAGEPGGTSSGGGAISSSAPWSLPSAPSRFSSTLRRSVRQRPVSFERDSATIVGASRPVRAAAVGLMDRAPALPGRLLPVVRPGAVGSSAEVGRSMAVPSLSAPGLPTSAPSVGRPSPGTTPSPPAASTATAGPRAPAAAGTADVTGVPAAAAAGVTGVPGADDVADVRAQPLAGSTREPGPVPTVRRHARGPSRSRARSTTYGAAVAMPDQLVVRRWARHGRRNAALATGFGVDSPIRPATARALGTPAPPAAGAAPATPTTSQGAAFATAPWVTATSAGRQAPAVPLIGRPPASAPPAATEAPATPQPWSPGRPASAPGQTPRIATARALPAAPGAAATNTPADPLVGFGGAWAPAPGGDLGDVPPSAPAETSGSATQVAAAGDTGPSALLRALPVAPPRTGPISAEPPVPPTSPLAPTSAGGAFIGTPTTSATFTPAEIERIRSGAGSLLERTAHLFAASPGPAPVHQPDRSTGGSAVFHQTSTDGMTPALTDPHTGMGTGMGDPWAAGPPVPASGLSAAAGDAEEIEPSGATLDRIVDAVVERIEDRVIDELERRGRHEWRVV